MDFGLRWSSARRSSRGGVCDTVEGMGHHLRASGAVVLGLCWAACSPDTSGFGRGSSGSAGTTASDEDPTGSGVSMPTGLDGPGTSEGGPTPTADSGTSMVTSEGTTDPDSTGTSTSSTGEPTEQMMEWAPALAECVLLAENDQPYGGPAECATSTSNVYSGTAGLMTVDRSLNGGGGNGRTTVVYLRFDWPVEMRGAELLELELVLTVFPGGGSGVSTGSLWSTVSFEEGDLDVSPPPAMQTLLIENLGPAPAGMPITWSLDPEDFSLSEPGHLLLEEAVLGDGVVYWSLDAPVLADRPLVRARVLL